MRETRQERGPRARAILDRLLEEHSDAKIALDFGSPLELMVAVVLSAQCTDARVNQVTPSVFARYPTAEALAAARAGELEGLIRSCGLFRAKARSLIAASKVIVAEHAGRVPGARAALAELPGIGNKSAGVISMHLSGEPAFPVDTHVARLARRLGLTRQSHPDKIEADLRALLPPELWRPGHHALIFHGRRVCHARRPECERCAVAARCPRVGVGKAGEALADGAPAARRRPRGRAADA